MSFNINAIKIGDKVRIGTTKTIAYGIVRNIKIDVTHVKYAVEITSSLVKKMFRLHETYVLRHNALRTEDNDPESIMKSIL